MKTESTLKFGIIAVVLALISLIAIKPTINGDFHARYLDNLNALKSLSSSLVRQHLLVRDGQVKHYDFLESELQRMERTAALAALTPEHTGEEFNKTAQDLSAAYLKTLATIRNKVELSKRSIGLLNNSRVALERMLKQLNKTMLGNQSAEGNSEALALAVKLNQALRVEAGGEVINALLDETSDFKVVPSSLLAQIRLHTSIVDNFAEPLVQASEYIYTTVDTLHQPEKIRSLYLERHEKVLAMTTWQLWASYALAGCLVVLSILLSMVGAKARRQAEAAMRDADEARNDTEQKIIETKEAVLHCNRLLEKLGNGDFSDRITMTFSAELNDLKQGVNSTADSVEFTMRELQRVMEAMQNGDFNTQIDERVTGEFRDQVERTNSSLQATMSGICAVMNEMSNGIFTQRVDLDLKGSFDVLKVAVNDSMQFLEHSLSEISTVVELQAEGDFTHRIEGSWPGELNSLSTSINSTAEKVHRMVSDIQKLSIEVTQASNSVLENSQQMKSQSEYQATAIDDALQTARNVSQLIDKNRDSTRSASTLAAQSQSDAGNCRDISENATQAMASITTKTAEISKISTTIQTIASKTNLLSLNAAVEAARAKEHGKGFSVVAGEVKALAKMSAEASASIGLLIEETDRQVRSGSESVKNTSAALTTIEESIVHVSDISQSIAEASEEQLMEMNTMTEKVGEAYELSKTNQELAIDTHNTSLALDDLSQKMNSLVSFFKVSNTEKVERQYKKAA